MKLFYKLISFLSFVFIWLGFVGPYCISGDTIFVVSYVFLTVFILPYVIYKIFEKELKQIFNHLKKE